MDVSKYRQERERLEKMLREFRQNKEDLILLEISIKKGKSYLNSKSSFYYRYQTYVTELIKLKKEREINELQSREREKELKGKIAEINKKLKEVGNDKELIEQKNVIASELKAIKESNELMALEINKYKAETIYQIEEDIENIETKIVDIENKIYEINDAIKSSRVRAKANGYVEFVNRIDEGMFLGSGVQVAKIVIGDKNEFKVEGYLGNGEKSSIKEGQEARIKIRVDGDVKILKGEVEYINKGLRIDETTRTGYYLVEVGRIREGNKYLKSGQICEINVIVGKRRVMEFLLDKLGL
ncbi:HlyD family secretion protein [Caldicellulosiruptor acetigenus]|uniref:hypothetical protein n=1 Tax=Caldicellulosiruptor acetigenus TaxID=301953 RepID=UPI0001E9B712|nr:hypothetical protein [Caldicellulosiruptor acetigenus]